MAKGKIEAGDEVELRVAIGEVLTYAGFFECGRAYNWVRVRPDFRPASRRAKPTLTRQRCQCRLIKRKANPRGLVLGFADPSRAMTLGMEWAELAEPKGSDLGCPHPINQVPSAA